MPPGVVAAGRVKLAAFSTKLRVAVRRRAPTLMAARNQPWRPSSVSITAVGWKMNLPSPKKASSLPVGNTRLGMMDKPILFRLAFDRRSLGCRTMSPRPWASNLYSRSSFWLVVPRSVGSARPDMMLMGSTIPSSTPICRRAKMPTAPWNEEVIRLSTAQVDSAPATLPSKSRGVRDQVLTRPNEKSLGARIWEALRVMNPFESTAGRNTCRSMAPLVNLPTCWALAWPRPARASTQKVESARSLRGKAGLMKSPETGSRRALGPLAPGRTATVGVSITACEGVSKTTFCFLHPLPACGSGLDEGLACILAW